jgi:uncharacterized protein YggT (Ycf19 family)
MATVYDLVGRLVIALLYAMQFLMLGRALMSWFLQEEDNKLARFLFAATEPFVYPIRKFLNKFEFFSNMPIDMSFLAAMLILITCTTFLNGTLI